MEKSRGKNPLLALVKNAINVGHLYLMATLVVKLVLMFSAVIAIPTYHRIQKQLVCFFSYGV
jgi:hypothetical protein